MTDNQFNQLFDLVTKSVNGIQRIEKDVAVLKDDVAVLKDDVAVLKDDVAVLKSDVAVLKDDMSEVKTDIAELKSDVSELKAGQSRIEKQIRINNAAVNEIAGEHFRIRGIVNELEKATV